MTDAPSGDPKKFVWIGDQDWSWLIGAVARIDRNVARLLGETQRVETKMAAVDDALQALTDQVTANTSAEASAAALISELAGMIQTHVDNPVALTDLAAKLKASADALAAAVTANTPVPAPATP